jgi:hypothetical protein
MKEPTQSEDSTNEQPHTKDGFSAGRKGELKNGETEEWDGVKSKTFNISEGKNSNAGN